MVKKKDGRNVHNGPAGWWVECAGDTLVIRFPSKRNVLSTSWLNGGYRGDLSSVFNHRIAPGACSACHSGGSVRAYLEGVAQSLGLDIHKTTGLVTSAEMKNAVLVTESFRDVSVCAIVTAGIDRNGVRAGDPASYWEDNCSFTPLGGTINTILVVNADLPAYAMARAVMTATEAKAAALQQLMAGSLYSTGIATGSGTDMIAVVADPASPLRLTDAGTHSKLGELTGKAVLRAVHAALVKETGLSPRSQRDVLARLGRYRVTGQDLWAAAAGAAGADPSDPEGRERFYRHLEQWAGRPGAVAPVAAALHVIDEESWGLLPRKEACEAVSRILMDGSGAWVGGRRPAGETPLRCLVAALAGLISRTIPEGTAPPGRALRRQGTHGKKQKKR